jgi:hypothetical protein
MTVETNEIGKKNSGHELVTSFFEQPSRVLLGQLKEDMAVNRLPFGIFKKKIRIEDQFVGQMADVDGFYNVFATGDVHLKALSMHGQDFTHINAKVKTKKVKYEPYFMMVALEVYDDFYTTQSTNAFTNQLFDFDPGEQGSNCPTILAKEPGASFYFAAIAGLYYDVLNIRGELISASETTAPSGGGSGPNAGLVRTTSNDLSSPHVDNLFIDVTNSIGRHADIVSYKFFTNEAPSISEFGDNLITFDLNYPEGMGFKSNARTNDNQPILGGSTFIASPLAGTEGPQNEPAVVAYKTEHGMYCAPLILFPGNDDFKPFNTSVPSQFSIFQSIIMDPFDKEKQTTIPSYFVPTSPVKDDIGNVLPLFNNFPRHLFKHKSQGSAKEGIYPFFLSYIKKVFIVMGADKRLQITANLSKHEKIFADIAQGQITIKNTVFTHPGSPLFSGQIEQKA